MYNATKSNSINEAKAIKIAGAEKVEEVLSLNCDFSNRVIDDCYGVSEMSASVKYVDVDGNDCILTVNYLVDNDQISKSDGDLSNCDFDDYSFEIN